MLLATSKKRMASVVGAAAAVALLAGCASGDPGGAPDSGELEATHFVVQVAGGPQSAQGEGLQVFADHVEKESGGLYTFELHFSGAIAGIAAMPEAMRSGIVDIGQISPAYAPNEFPITNSLLGLDNLETPSSPILNTLVAIGSRAEYIQDEHLLRELQDSNMQPIAVGYHSSPKQHLLCVDSPVTSLSEAAGKRVRAAGEGPTAAANVLGMTPVNVPFSEAFEALQRGVIDCTIGEDITAGESGYTDVAHYWTIDADIGFEGLANPIVIRKDLYDSLGAAGQKLIMNASLDVLVRDQIERRFIQTRDIMTDAKEQGIEFVEWAPDAETALIDYYSGMAGIVADKASAAGVENADEWVASFVEMQKRWTEIVEGLGYNDDAAPSWQDLAGTDLTIDADAFIERYMQEFAM